MAAEAYISIQMLLTLVIWLRQVVVSCLYKNTIQLTNTESIIMGEFTDGRVLIGNYL